MGTESEATLLKTRENGGKVPLQRGRLRRAALDTARHWLFKIPVIFDCPGKEPHASGNVPTARSRQAGAGDSWRRDKLSGNSGLKALLITVNKGRATVKAANPGARPSC